MGQIAICADDGRIVEAFSIDRDEWTNIKTAALGTYLMPGTKWPAVPKTSNRGLQYFAHKSGYPGVLPKPESFAHTRLKIALAQQARAIGLEASVETPGFAPDGSTWVADVLLKTSKGQKLAIEIQLSPQTLDEFLMRSARYVASGVSPIWILSHQREKTLTRTIWHREGNTVAKNGILVSDLPEIRHFTVCLNDKDSYPCQDPELHFGRGAHHVKLSIEDMLAGLVVGRAVWEYPSWIWQ